MQSVLPYKLTPADVIDLRASVRWRLSDQTLPGPNDQIPFICFAREDAMAANAPAYSPDAFVLHTQGHLQAISPRIEALAACLRAEWAEPGFVARIMSTSTDCEHAILDPDERAAVDSRRRFEEKRARDYAEEQARTLRRSTPPPTPRQPNPTTVSASDLWGDQ